MLAPQAGNSELTNGIQIVHIASSGNFAVCRLNGLARHVGSSNILYVAALIAIGGPVGVTRVLALCASLHRQSEIINLLARIVVVELPVH